MKHTRLSVAPVPKSRRSLFGWALLLLVGSGMALVQGGQGQAPRSAPAADSGCCCEGEEPERLTSRPRPTPPAATPIKVGERVETGPGQRRRLTLPDGSVLFVNEKTTATLEQANALALAAGEVYVEGTRGEGPFSVKTATDVVRGQGASFGVRTAAPGTGVVVTRGQAQVSGLKTPVAAGQQLTPGRHQPSAAPRASHLLGWTRELMAAAESPLVPASEYSGGALVAIDPNGQEAKLSLRKYHVDVFIEDGFARTTIDQTYFNQSAAQMEGTFYFPLPADASVSHLAMYVDGTLMEAGMVERDVARQVYETIRYQRRDPALLEWVDGSTFKMRVFPIEGRQEKRVLLSYTQKLDSLYGQAQYRFPAGHTLPKVREWSFQARVKGGAELAWNSPSHQLQANKDKSDLLLRAEAKDTRVDRDVVLAVTEPALADGQAVRFSTTEVDGARYLMMRLRPDLVRPVQHNAANAGPRRWVFLFESSGDRDPLLARAQVEVVRNLLAQLGPDDTFHVLAAGTRVRPLGKEAQAVTPASVQAAVSFLEGSHLVGALDLGNGLAEAGARAQQGAETYVIHVGSGVAAMGTRDDNELTRKLPAGVHYVGVGVGKRWARSFMKLAAERTGGYFTQINPDEPIAWRCFELFGTVQTLAASPLRQIEAQGFLAFNHFPAAGEEFCAVTRLEGKELPESVGVGFGGEWTNLPVRDVKPGADYLPRSWARLKIDQLLAANATMHKDTIVALSKAMYVMTPYTSLLVLENDDMYTQYKVERGRKEHWAEYPAPKKIAVVTEPDPDMPGDPGKYVKKLREVAQTVLVREPLRILNSPGGQQPAVAGSLTEFESVNGLKAEGTLARQLGAGDQDRRRRHLARLRTYYELGAPPQPLVEQAERRLMDLPVLDGFAAPLTPRPGIPAAGEPANSPPSNLALGFQNTAGSLMAGQLPTAQVQFRSVAGAAKAPANIALRGRSGNGRRLYLRPPAESMKELATRGEPQQQLLDQDVEEELGGRSNGVTFGLEFRDFGGDVKNLELGLKRADPDLATPPADRVPLLYQRPGYSGQERIFFDLVAYAPGLNTSSADIEAVLEAEVQPNLGALPGRIEPAVRPLFDRARAAGWRQLVLPRGQGQPDLAIDFDGKGRFAYERTLPPGLRERVVCDGTTLQHLYGQLGLAARRTVSRFHRDDLAAVVPWFVPPPEDLARGADLKLVGQHTAAVVPHGAEATKDDKGQPLEYVRWEMVFGEDGGLAEQRLVRMPKAEVLSRQVLGADGTVRLLDGKGKELSARRGKLGPAPAPQLNPDTKNLVVLNLPYRTPEHVLQALKIEKTSLPQLHFADAVQLLAANFATGNGEQAAQVFKQALHPREQRQLGLYVLLAACGQNLDGQNLDVQVEYPESPLAQYLALHSSPVLRRHASQWAVHSNQWPDGLLQHLAVTHALYQRWQTDQLKKVGAARLREEREKALQYVRQNRNSSFGWVMLCLLEDRAEEDTAFHTQLAEACRLFDDLPGLAHAAQYEQARCLYRGGQLEQARQRFRSLYEKTLERGVLPAIDGAFRKALLSGGPQTDAWNELLRSTARQLVKQKHRPAVLALARQCWQLEDQPLANHLLTLALDGIAEEKERTAMTLAGIGFLRETSQLPEADRLLTQLLAEPKQKERPVLWRLAAEIAEGREQTAPSLERLERALDLEFRKPPEAVDLEALRRDYGKLLQHYQGLADAMVALKLRPPEGFLAKVVAVADRWRALDPEATQPCEVAARVLRSLGDRQLAWEYQTTPVGKRPNEAEPWVGLAQGLGRTGELDLAELAYKAAAEAEPTNAQLLWDRAQNLRRAGRSAEAQVLLRRIADGSWQPRFQPLQSQARLQLTGS